ncbi:MAG: cell division protein FtsA [Actinobacteria bacterium]|nr:cell division protein FtsA [Actinomycetota bacterium]
MAKNNTILGLDLGSSKICAAICQVNDQSELSVLGLGTSVTAGLSHGSIQDADELSRSIERAIKRASSGLTSIPQKVMVNVPLLGFRFVHNVGLLISKEDTGQISQTDQTECIRRSKNIVQSPEQKMLHMLPINYKVDQQEVKNPVGVFGKTLEVKSHLILAHSETILLLSKLLKRLNLHISGLVYDPLSLSQLVLAEKERDQGAILVDIGGAFTKICLIKEQKLYRSKLIPIGGDTFTKDIAVCLNVSIPEAERLKIIYGDVCLSRINPSETLDITTLSEGPKKIKRILLSQILEARAAELYKLITAEVENELAQRHQVVVIGGGSLLKGMVEYGQAEFGVSTREGLPDMLKSVVESTVYSSAVGLVFYGLKTGSISSPKSQQIPLLERCRSWLKARQ